VKVASLARAGSKHAKGIDGDVTRGRHDCVLDVNVL